MSTETVTTTQTITAADVREVMSMTTVEITAVCNAAARAARDFDIDGALVDCSLLALNDVITAIRLQLYCDDELVREHSYTLTGGPLGTFGPPPDQPPTGPVPDGARVRLVVTPNTRKAEDFREGWFRRLGWGNAKPLQIPKDARHETYGTFVSGGYGVERRLLVNPKYDLPVATGDERTMLPEDPNEFPES